MPAISTQIYGAAVSGIQNAAPARLEKYQPRQAEHGNPPYSVELSQAALRESDATTKDEMIAPELLKALNNDVTRTSSEMSEAISANHLHIQGMFSEDASSSFNFFGVSMPLATTSFEFPSVRTDDSSDSSSSGNGEGAQGSASVSTRSVETANAAANTQTSPPPSETRSVGQAAPQAQSAETHMTTPSEKEIVSDSRKDATVDFDGFSAQLSGMAVAATASQASSQQAVQR